MERWSDTIIVEKVLKGETGCFTRLLDKYNKQVFTLIVKITGNREDAEEITQDVFIKVFGSLSKFRGESSLSTWIYRIAYNMAISAVRKKAVDCVPIDESIVPDVPDEQDEWHETGYSGSDTERRIACLERALDQLPPDERAMIMLFYKGNKPAGEIARIMKLTETNVKTKLFRIRKKIFILIKRLEEQSDGNER